MTNEEQISQLKDMQEKIMDKINNYGDLNILFLQKQQKVFIKSCLTIMDTMSNQLLYYQQQYRNIDDQITKQPQCVNLSNQLNFFQLECLDLKKQLQQIQQETINQNNYNKLLTNQNQQLHSELFINSKQYYKYNQRENSLRKTIGSFTPSYPTRMSKLFQRSKQESKIQQPISFDKIDKLFDQIPSFRKSANFEKRALSFFSNEKGKINHRNANINRTLTRNYQRSAERSQS